MITRRHTLAGIGAAAVAAFPAVGLSIGRNGDPRARIEHHTRELEKAMRDCYGAEVEVLAYDATAEMKPLVMVVAHTL